MQGLDQLQREGDPSLSAILDRIRRSAIAAIYVDQDCYESEVVGPLHDFVGKQTCDAPQRRLPPLHWGRTLMALSNTSSSFRYFDEVTKLQEQLESGRPMEKKIFDIAHIQVLAHHPARW